MRFAAPRSPVRLRLPAHPNGGGVSVFASKTKLIATSAAGVLALGVATQSAAKAPAQQAPHARGAAQHLNLQRRSDAVARYYSAYRGSKARDAAPTEELASVEDKSTSELPQAASRLAGSAGDSTGSEASVASPESYGVSQTTL